jgi:electron transfer flavoprotein alpha subunit
MNTLIYIELNEGKLKKAALEAASYGGDIAKKIGGTANAVVLGECTDDLSELGAYGIANVYHIKNQSTSSFDARSFSKMIAEVVKTQNANILVFSNTIIGKSLAPQLSVMLKAGLVTGAIDLPKTENGFIVKKSVFSGKAFSEVKILTDLKIISLNPNAYNITKGEGKANVSAIETAAPENKVKVTAVQKVTGKVSLSEADIVVSGGRGLKGPENWGLVTELAELLGAATACSRPVADVHWRPHHEHVGQTGFAIAPNLYIAIGISGAIQHLAGVNRSKIIVVINKDPEAPFFKAADYGIVGDAFEVVPKMIEAVKKIKQGA